MCYLNYLLRINLADVLFTSPGRGISDSGSKFGSGFSSSGRNIDRHQLLQEKLISLSQSAIDFKQGGILQKSTKENEQVNFEHLKENSRKIYIYNELQELLDLKDIKSLETLEYIYALLEIDRAEAELTKNCNYLEDIIPHYQKYLSGFLKERKNQLEKNQELLKRLNEKTLQLEALEKEERERRQINHKKMEQYDGHREFLVELDEDSNYCDEQEIKLKNLIEERKEIEKILADSDLIDKKILYINFEIDRIRAINEDTLRRISALHDVVYKRNTVLGELKLKCNYNNEQMENLKKNLDAETKKHNEKVTKYEETNRRMEKLEDVVKQLKSKNLEYKSRLDEIEQRFGESEKHLNLEKEEYNKKKALHEESESALKKKEDDINDDITKLIEQNKKRDESLKKDSKIIDKKTYEMLREKEVIKRKSEGMAESSKSEIKLVAEKHDIGNPGQNDLFYRHFIGSGIIFLLIFITFSRMFGR